MQVEPYIFAITKIPVNHPRPSVWARLLACMHPAQKPGDLDFQWVLEGQSILIQTVQWGLIGSIKLEQGTTSQTDIQFYTPPYPTPQETERVENAIRAQILNNRRTLLDLYNQRERILQTLAEDLYKHKQAILIQISAWLAGSLGVWGLTEERTIPVTFNFLIEGTPAQFGVMLRHYFPTYRHPDGVETVTVKVIKPGGGELREIPAEANPIQVKLVLGKSRVEITTHTLPDRQSLLRVSLSGDVKSWRLWDALREEMKRLNWFHLPEVPAQLLEKPIENPPPAPNQQTVVIEEPWLSVPDTGNNRQVVRLWNEHWTCKEISQKVGGTEKTILNRINLLRKQFGPQIVPYRNAIPEKRRGSRKD